MNIWIRRIFWMVITLIVAFPIATISFYAAWFVSLTVNWCWDSMYCLEIPLIIFFVAFFVSLIISFFLWKKNRRNENHIRDQLALASTQLDKNPEGFDAILSFIKATYKYFDQFNGGDIELAISTAREGQKKFPENLDFIYWEATCQFAAGFYEQAHSNFIRFLEKAQNNSNKSDLIKEAENQIIELQSFL